MLLINVFVVTLDTVGSNVSLRLLLLVSCRWVLCGGVFSYCRTCGMQYLISSVNVIVLVSVV